MQIKQLYFSHKKRDQQKQKITFELIHVAGSWVVSEGRVRKTGPAVSNGVCVVAQCVDETAVPNGSW